MYLRRERQLKCTDIGFCACYKAIVTKLNSKNLSILLIFVLLNLTAILQRTLIFFTKTTLVQKTTMTINAHSYRLMVG